jgi:adenosylcobinamide kinase / adenosylcobinamide-phosphate guanylyltransferase
VNSKLQLILGGARSGKSRFSLDQRNESSFERRFFLATATTHDEEMKDRVRKHQAQRGSGWETIEEPYHLPDALQRFKDSEKTIIVVDCATLWLSNLLCGVGGKSLSTDEIEKKFDDLLDVLSQIRSHVRIVSNEVGLAVVPDNVLGRQFRDLQGLLNQKLASQASQVFFMVAGLSQKLK